MITDLQSSNTVYKSAMIRVTILKWFTSVADDRAQTQYAISLAKIKALSPRIHLEL